MENYNYILLLGEKVDELGDLIKENSCLVEICLNDVDDLCNINIIVINKQLKDVDYGDALGFGDAEDGYYIIRKIFQENYNTIKGRSCNKEVNYNVFMDTYNERLKFHCPDAFND